MNGAREYARLFETGQYGRLYVVSGSHARGRTFRIFVLPKDETAIPNGPNNGPANKETVEVYGVVGGQRGWTESYGWLHQGMWQEDFLQLKIAKEQEIAEEKLKYIELKKLKEEQEAIKINNLLMDY